MNTYTAGGEVAQGAEVLSRGKSGDEGNNREDGGLHLEVGD